ncbi:MAG: DMT family transporter [Acidobacteria bacterium]|nr:DMT family transporter [Acidobacteriota bacterium]MBV9476457.1 DMT family transporter [Acidobacteriota bacterium]
MKRHHLAALALLATAGAWGATFVLVKSVIQRIAPEPFIFWRFTLAGAILCVFAAMRGRFTRALLRPGITLGLLVFFGYWAQTRGLLTISPSRSALLTGIYVVLVPFFQWRTSGRPKPAAWLAALLALAGTWVFIGGGFEARLTFGDLLTLGGAVLFALHVVLSARWSKHETATALAAVQVLFVGLAAGPLAIFAKPTPWDFRVVAAIVFTAVVTTALAFAALMWGQAHVTATEAAVILSFEPVAAALVSIAFYGEPLTAAFFIGAALIVGAMVLSQV